MGFNRTFLSLMLFLFVLTMFSINQVEADVISSNSGGNTEIIVNPDLYIDGFFSGSDLACGNGIIETENGETCDDGNTASGDGCSNICVTETAGGGGGGGGGGGTTSLNLSVIPSEFNLDLYQNTQVQKIVQIRNTGISSATVSVSQQELDGRVSFGATSFTIPPGQKVDLGITFFALNETGFFTGTILIGGKEVLVAINVATIPLLFDSNIVVLNKDFQVSQTDKLLTLTTLIPLGTPERTDVTLNFVIKDYLNKVYLTKSETLLIEKQTELTRGFDLGTLPLGDYVVGLDLVYPNGVAPSSAYFKVIESLASGIFGRIVLFLVMMILIVMILIMLILVSRRLKAAKEMPSQET